MIGDITLNEVELLNSYQMLSVSGQRELKDYIRYLLCKQYKRDAMVTVFHNKLLHNLFHGLLHLVEREEIDREQVGKRISQIKDLYYGLFEQVHVRYSQHVDELDTNDVVSGFGANGFANLERALNGGNSEMLRYEILNFYQEYTKLSQRKDARSIVAV
ncbi:MAG: hypothetical protein GXY34_00990 [Syntrophomonadaceae bacterium]|nr:hypothetical protein [Syntrophomonadaceae bacterium]